MAKIEVMQMLRDAEKVAVSELGAIRAAIRAMAGTLTTSISGAPMSRGPQKRREVTGNGTPRRRRRMSAKAREAVSKRMRKYWADRRAKTK